MIPLYKVHVPDSAAEAVSRVLSSGQIAGDGNLPEFEGKLRESVHAVEQKVGEFSAPALDAGLAGKVAFTDGERSLTYGELQAKSCQFAAALQALGLRPEERLTLLLYDTIDFPVAFLGAIKEFVGL